MKLVHPILFLLINVHGNTFIKNTNNIHSIHYSYQYPILFIFEVSPREDKIVEAHVKS